MMWAAVLMARRAGGQGMSTETLYMFRRSFQAYFCIRPAERFYVTKMPEEWEALAGRYARMARFRPAVLKVV